MSKTFIKLFFITTGTFLVGASFIVALKFVSNESSLGSVNNDVLVVKNKNGDSVEIGNPAKSTNFADIGGSVYVSDERQLGEQIGYSFSYFADDNSFAIDISGKPTKTYRDRASQYLLESLQISEEEACTLRVYVGVSHSVDSNLSGKNLGLSFCPGSVEL